MTSLDAQLAAFKHRAQNQPVLPRAVVKTVQKVDSPLFSPISFPPSPSEVGSTPEPGQPPRKRQKKSPVVYSQPRDTGVGQHLYTQLTYAVDYLKHHSEPISAERIASYLSLPMVSREFITSLQNNSRITYHADTDLYEFRPLHNIRNKSSLLTTLANQPRGEGLSIKEIKDGYPNVEDDLTSLEFEEGHILVIRGKKDGLARMVWYNDPKLNVTISEEFKEIYHGLKVPEAGDLPRELEKLGMMPASVDPRTMKKGVAENSKEAKKRRGRRRGKITNTHLVGILRDYTR